MNNELNYCYKTSDFLSLNEKEKKKSDPINCYGYNFDSTSRRIIKEDYSKVYRFYNKEFIRNNKIR